MHAFREFTLVTRRRISVNMNAIEAFLQSGDPIGSRTLIQVVGTAYELDLPYEEFGAWIDEEYADTEDT